MAPQKIVVMRYRFIGDTILSVPFLKALREKYPSAEIHYLTGNDAYDLIARCPYIDKAIAFEPRKLGWLGAIRFLKEQRYDMAYLLKRSFSSAVFAFLAGISNRIGFNTDKRAFLLTKAIAYKQHSQHEAQCFLDLLNETDSTPPVPEVDLTSWITSDEKAQAESFLKAGAGPRIVLHATSTNTAKCWPLSHFQTLAKALIENEGATIYALGTANDSSTYEKLQKALPTELQSRVINLCGKTSLVESMAVLSHMDLVVANDSGMTHMASAMDIPVIALFGPSDPKQWFPLSSKAVILTHPDMHCRPCHMRITCNHLYPCLTEITPEQVLSTCKTQLTRWNGKTSLTT